MCAVEFNVRALQFPTFFLDRGEWEGLSEKLEDPFFERLHENNLRVLERLESEEDRRVGSRTLKNRLLRGTVAWYLTRRQRHLDLALAALETCCSRRDLWWVTDESVQMIRAANLSTGEMLYNVAFAYDALHPYLSDDQKRMCLDALINEGLAAYLKGLELHDWWEKCDFNWNSALHANAGLAALAIRDEDRELSDRVLREALTGLPYMIDAFYEDGGWIEGVMYFGTAIGHLTDFVAPYYRLTGDDLGLLSNRAVHDTITWRMYMWGGDGRCYNFSDVSEFYGGRGLSQIYWWARMLDRPDWTYENDHGLDGRSRGAGLFHDIDSFWYREAFQPTREPELEPLRHFKGIDWLTYRGDRLWLAFRSGFNGGNHDNDDLGNFILGFDDERFLCDPGYGPKNASDHNCIVVRRFEQADCATARIERLQELPGGFYLRCNIQQAFPFSTVHYDRHLLVIDNRHILLVDDICGRDRIRVTVRTHFQTRLPCRRTEEGWVIEGQKNRLRFIHLTPALFPEEDDWSHRHDRNAPPIHRFSWKNEHDTVHMLQATLLTFGDPEFSHQISHERLRLTLDGRTYVLEGRDGRFDLAGGPAGRQA